MERSRGIDAANIITILMEQKGYTLQQAVDHAGEAFSGLVRRLFQSRQNFPRFGQETDDIVNKYIDAMETWVAGYLDWSFASKRYFGQASEEIKKTRIVKLYPRKPEP
jgi:alpha-muurolene/germacrene-A/gamma-muurolene synthase